MSYLTENRGGELRSVRELHRTGNEVGEEILWLVCQAVMQAFLHVWFAYEPGFMPDVLVWMLRLGIAVARSARRRAMAQGSIQEGIEPSAAEAIANNGES